MRLLDLFCGAGGAAMGYYRAGFTDIVGVDIKPQKRYPFEFVLGDALEYAAQYGHLFDMIHASPICKGNTPLKALHKKKWPDQIPETRRLLKLSGRPYVIENVMGAKNKLINPIMLCGTMFGLRVIRHRLFECEPVIWWPPAQCRHIGKIGNESAKENGKRLINSFDNFDILCVSGHNFRVNDARIAMGIDWMVQKELSQAIPPTYTEWLGGQMLAMF